MYPIPQHVQQPQHHPQRQQQSSPAPKSLLTVQGVPSVYIENGRLVVGSSQSTSTRSYTPLKVLGDGSFGTVWLCDWHGILPPNTPLSPMQCGAGARPEWAGKRLVAVKRMKKKWEGGWDECQRFKELESLRAIPFHPNIIPLYDFFLMPSTKELYFVFESMEGNLYHLIKTRKGRALAGGLVSSIFFQIVSGLDHVHTHGYFHRDMKPENVLVTTTGLFDYTSLSPVAPPNAPPERDVVAIIKLADFGLARETKSKPPYTEYVSTRWYRAPEVLLLSRVYSNPVDMWALGTIMAELVNLRPLFPGADQLDQVGRICEILGDPSDEYGLDASQAPIGGGPWPRGIEMARMRGFEFRKTQPQDLHSLFDRSVPLSLVHCIRDLLRYDPDARLTSHQCLHHRYLAETMPRNNIPLPNGVRLSSSLPYTTSPQRNGITPPESVSSLSSRHITPSHPQSTQLRPPQIPNATASHRAPFFPQDPSPHSRSQSHSPSPSIRIYQHPAQGSSGLIHEESRVSDQSWVSSTNGGDYPMDISPQTEGTDDYIPNGHPMDVQPTPTVQQYSSRPDPMLGDSSGVGQSQSTKLAKLSGLSFGKKHTIRSLFGGDKHHHQPELPPVHEIPAASTSTGSLKRTQSAGSDRSVRDRINKKEVDNKKDVDNKREAEKLHREAEKQRRALAEKNQRDQARAVMHKRNLLLQQKSAKEAPDIEWSGGSEQPHYPASQSSIAKGKQAATGPIRRDREPALHVNGNSAVNAASGRFIHSPAPTNDQPISINDRRSGERVTKVRRMDLDDDHSLSSSDVHSTGRMSSISFATVDSDPGPSRIRNRPSLFGLNRMTSTSSLRTSFDDFSPSARSSHSFSLEGQLANDFRTQASMEPDTPLTGNLSPPPMQMLSLSPSLSPPISPSPQWMQVPQQRSETLSSRRGHAPSFISVPQPPARSNSYSPYEFNGQFHGNGHPPNSGHKTEINPIFKVPPLPTPTSADPTEESFSTTSLPPFSQLEAVAGGGYDYPPLSPMSFTTPSEDASSP